MCFLYPVRLTDLGHFPEETSIFVVGGYRGVELNDVEIVEVDKVNSNCIKPADYPR